MEQKERRLIYIALMFGFFGLAAFAQGSISDYVQNVFFNNSGANNITTNIFVNNNQTTVYQNYTFGGGLNNLSSNTTNDLAEGSNNLYYTNARVLAVGNNTYMALGNVSSCNVNTQKYVWNATNRSWDCSADVGGGGNASYPVDLSNNSQVTGVLPKSSMPLNTSFTAIRYTNGSGALNLPSNTIYRITMDTKDYDYTNEWNGTAFTVNRSGLYTISIGVGWVSTSTVADKTYGLYVQKNGNVVGGTAIGNPIASGDMQLSYSSTYYLNVSDYIQAYAYHEDGAGTSDMDSGYVTFIEIHESRW